MKPELYRGRLEIVDFERAKTARIDDRKLVHISNIDQFTICRCLAVLRCSKSTFQAVRSINLLSISGLKMIFNG